MITRKSRQERDLYRKSKWLVFFRALFALVLLGSLSIALMGPQIVHFLADRSLFYLFIIAIGLLLISIAYAVALPRIRHLNTFAYFQIIIDTILVTLIIFVTGSFASIFSFLYLVVIMYATMVIYRKGGMVIATLCALQYGIMIDLEYFNLIQPIGMAAGEMISSYSWQYVIFRLVIIIAACYSIAFLSGFLSEQERRAKLEMWAMEDQMKRVERLAAAGEMAAGLTHEIKNPLASLTGSIQMLRESIPYDPAHDKLMRIVMREADRLSSLVTEFLMFSRPQVGNVESVRIDRAIEEIVSLFRKDPSCKDRIEVGMSLASGKCIQIDPEHFSQVMWNILNNAAEAINGRGKIDIALHPAGKDYLSISVQDNGAGISAENLDSVFDPFFSTKARGTGLGLSIVQQIIGLYHGFIDMQSTPGKGTTVVLKFKGVPCQGPA